MAPIVYSTSLRYSQSAVGLGLDIELDLRGVGNTELDDGRPSHTSRIRGSPHNYVLSCSRVGLSAYLSA